MLFYFPSVCKFCGKSTAGKNAYPAQRIDLLFMKTAEKYTVGLSFMHVRRKFSRENTVYLARGNENTGFMSGLLIDNAISTINQTLSMVMSEESGDFESEHEWNPNCRKDVIMGIRCDRYGTGNYFFSPPFSQ